MWLSHQSFVTRKLLKDVIVTAYLQEFDLKNKIF